jgi:hypothetical protein
VRNGCAHVLAARFKCQLRLHSQWLHLRRLNQSSSGLDEFHDCLVIAAITCLSPATLFASIRVRSYSTVPGGRLTGWLEEIEWLHFGKCNAQENISPPVPMFRQVH